VKEPAMTKADAGKLTCSVGYNSVETVSAVITWYNADGRPINSTEHNAFSATASVAEPCGSTD